MTEHPDCTVPVLEMHLLSVKDHQGHNINDGYDQEEVCHTLRIGKKNPTPQTKADYDTWLPGSETQGSNKDTMEQC